MELTTKTNSRLTHVIISTNQVTENRVTADLEIITENRVTADLEIITENRVTADPEIIIEN
jgi:hypothetical protein